MTRGPGLRSVLVVAAKFLVSGGLLALVLSRADGTAIVATLKASDPLLLAAWYATFPVAHALIAWRWRMLAPVLSFDIAHKYTWIGAFYAQVLPGSLAGDVAKGVVLAMKVDRAREGLVASIVAEKVIGLAALVAVLDLACVLLYGSGASAAPQTRMLVMLALALSALFFVATVALVGWALRTPAGASVPTSLVGRFAEAARYYGANPALVVRTFGLSLLIHGVFVVGTWLSFRTVGVEAGPVFAAIVYPVLAILLLAPISVSGIGVRDATLVVLFAAYGLRPESAVALSWMSLLAGLPTILIGGLVQLWEIHRRR